MSEYRLLDYITGGRHRVALLNGIRLLEYHEETVEDSSTTVDCIFLGRVERVLKDLGAAFVEIGQKKKGFLPIRETDSFQQRHPKALLTGDEVIVQVKKDPRGDKGAFLTRDISLGGRFLFAMPMNRFLGVSNRVEDPREQERLRVLGREIAEDRCGLILRSAALTAKPEELRLELKELLTNWNALLETVPARKAPAMLSMSESITNRILRDYSGRHTILYESNDGTIRSDAEMEALWRSARVDTQLELALRRKYMITGGAELVFDECEALTAIDVNSSRQVFAKEGSLPLQENLAAVEEIARQIRLRDLSGIIIIDFINMETDAERTQVLEALESAVSDDRVKTVVHGFTSLGLCEVTRKRTANTLCRRMELLGGKKNVL